MLSKHARSASPAQAAYRTQSLTVLVEDVDARFYRAKSADTKIVEDLDETIYGEQQHGAEDLEGHRGLFSRPVREPARMGSDANRPLRSLRGVAASRPHPLVR